MRKANERIFDDVVTGTTTVYSSGEFNELLGRHDRISLFLVVDTVSGTSPTITVQLQHSSDERNWVNKNGTPEINALVISPTATTTEAANDATGNYGCHSVRAAITLAGTNPSCRVRLYATLRDST